MEYQLEVVSEQAIMIVLGNQSTDVKPRHIQSISSQLEHHPFPWMIEYVPAYTTITIYFDPIKIIKLTPNQILPSQFAIQQIDQWLSTLMNGQPIKPRTITVPVCYGGEFGPDLEFVAKHNNLSTEEVIYIHTKGEYTVRMIGFAPAFPYLGGLSDKIHAPRKSTPRLKIPSGSVGIASGQTGIYTIESPGGWQLIGQTPLKLFRPKHEIPSLLQMGDIIKFKAIDSVDFKDWEADNTC